MTTPLVQAIARAVADGIGDDFDLAHRDKPHWIETRGESGGRYRDINEPRQPDYLDAAQAALTAITEAGYAVVPVEADADMMTAGEPLSVMAEGDTKEARVLRRLNAAAIYRAMISATNTGKVGE